MPARGYRFLNPYNFVRWLEPARSQLEDERARVMARCEPPPHDRWVGMSGKMSVRLSVETPLFIADPDGWQERVGEKVHPHYRFYCHDFGDGPERAIPATSLRGMLRSTFEAATNSCFAHTDYDRRLSYRMSPRDALKLVPGRLERRKITSSERAASDPNAEKPTERDVWQLRFLPGSEPIAVGSRPRGGLYAARVEQYDALIPAGRGRHRAPVEPVIPADLGHGDLCFALLQRQKFVWNVLRLAKTGDALLRHKRADQIVAAGVLCETGQNIEPKRAERFFFWTTQSSSKPRLAAVHDDVVHRFCQLIEDYRARHADEVSRRGEDASQARKKNGKTTLALSRFIVEPDWSLQDGEPVYAFLSGTDEAPVVEFLAPVAIPRVGFERMVHELLPEHLRACSDYEELCPACRTFGWVAREAEEAEVSKRVAYASRVRCSMGRIEDPDASTFPASLAILSAPKPTTVRFYLRPEGAPPQRGASDFEAGYDNPRNILRGRKVYRHHGHDGDVAYWTSHDREYRKTGENSDQNRSVEDVLAPGAHFTFDIEFENLAPIELGALLWTIELQRDMVHRLGYGKPLGLGSVRLQIIENSLLLMSPTSRYAALGNSGWTALSAEQILALRAQFETSMRQLYARPGSESEGFQDLANIVDLTALLSPPDPALPVHYPRTATRPSEEGKNFEWFMGNNRNRDARYVLELPSEEEGLPLLRKDGRVLG